MKKSGETPTAFPKGTIIHYEGIPCELLQDTPYYSETIKGKLKPDNQCIQGTHDKTVRP